MDTTYYAYANSLLINHHDALLSCENFYLISDLNADHPGYTIFLKDNVTFFPAPVTESGFRGVILHYEDHITPHPFDLEGDLKIDYMTPIFSGHSIFEISPVHTIMILRVKDHVMDLDFDEVTPLVRVSWEN